MPLYYFGQRTLVCHDILFLQILLDDKLRYSFFDLEHISQLEADQSIKRLKPSLGTPYRLCW